MTIPLELSVPHLALPLLVNEAGSFNTLQQDTPEEVAQSVNVLLGTANGERVMVPAYGISDPTFTNPDPNELTQAIAVWEPRAVAKVRIGRDPAGRAQVAVSVALAAAS